MRKYVDTYQLQTNLKSGIICALIVCYGHIKAKVAISPEDQIINRLFTIFDIPKM